jgi:hypothetical protein
MKATMGLTPVAFVACRIPENQPKTKNLEERR